ncbi:hypothetical protein WA026_023872 [Henosepilachna vigintioctopunctata]|uniref:Uncharacterized protein n=1 Tax=Henosepilachna vigintioctopunctata TaxID=420089 RepID=A0AAW1UTS9_9CUCU
MDEYWTNLHDSLNDNDTENVKRLLNSHEKNNANLKDIQIIKILLKQKDSQIIYLTTESIAEWAKIENNRNILTEKETLELLLELLNSKENTLNVVRALGNICYENENAAKLLSLEKILTLFYESTDITLLTKISGLLLNIFISNQDLQSFDKNKLLGHISSNLNDNSGLSVDETCLYSYILQIVYTLLAEYENEIIFSKNIYENIITIFKNSNIPELELICLQILYNASERDEVRKLLAESNVCERIIELIEKYKQLIDDEESRSILKMACDLINNILIEG